ncbi:MAG: sigma-54 dependent transcriptional regulator [Desulfobacterales bacterium]
MPRRILIVGDLAGAESAFADALARGFTVSFAANLLDAEKRLAKEEAALLILDLPPAGEPVEDLLHRARQIAPGIPVFATAPGADPEWIVRAVKAGAADFVSRPIAAEKLLLSVERALENRSLKNEIDYLRREQDVVYDTDRIIAVSPAMQKVTAEIRRLARTESTILITGETGTGKSFVSGNIHFNSPRRSRPFVKVNCANIPETLLESELFGHEKGAFTGADKTRIGRFEQAHGGTIFLDEFCELGPGLQAKLLRVLEDRSFERLGGNRTIEADVRVIAATNRDIEALVGEGRFREDLYYRINVLRIHIPPLRERREDIEPLARYLLGKIGRQLKKTAAGFSEEAMARLKEYDWPGNIRQLANTIERALLVAEGPRIEVEHLALPEIPRPAARATAPTAALPTLRLTAEQERAMIIRALEESLWIQKDAAKKLGISPRALNYRVRRLGIAHPRWRKNR